MSSDLTHQLTQLDRDHLWHPYSSTRADTPVYPVESAQGCRFKLTDGRELVDGMASWWSMIHGYNHPQINQAIIEQTQQLAHVMFGGLTHEPAVKLAKALVDLTPAPLEYVFFSDSGSVSVEVAIKMALQYWQVRGETQRHRLLTIRSGYHGDTFAAMSVCDPVTGMHQLFTNVLAQQFFADAPQCGFEQEWYEEDIASLRKLIETRHADIAAVILEPIVQGAGGMRFYSPEYLRRVRQLCDEHQILLIADEIATGFGRTGKLFACEHADIAPDILCIGKALTGGYMSLAATLCTETVSDTLSSGNPGVFMHGPTFMANPLACRSALASIELLLNSDWQGRIAALEAGMKQMLAPAADLPQVKEVRVLGGIGVIEAIRPVRMAEITEAFVARGVWLRPFGKLVYIMPPYITSTAELQMLCSSMCEVLADTRMLQ